MPVSRPGLRGNITLSEWDAWVAEVSRYGRLRRGDGGVIAYDDFDVTHVSLRLETKHIANKGRCLTPTASVGKSGGLTGDLTSARALLRAADGAISAIEDLYTLVSGAQVWEDGFCPCDTCRATGKVNHGTLNCTRCKGTGVR